MSARWGKFFLRAITFPFLRCCFIFQWEQDTVTEKKGKRKIDIRNFVAHHLCKQSYYLLLSEAEAVSNKSLDSHQTEFRWIVHRTVETSNMAFDWRAAAPWIFFPFVGSIPGSFLTKKNIPIWYEVRCQQILAT